MASITGKRRWPRKTGKLKRRTKYLQNQSVLLRPPRLPYSSCLFNRGKRRTGIKKTKWRVLYLFYFQFFLLMARITRISYINRQRSKGTRMRSGVIFEDIISSGLDRNVMTTSGENVFLGQNKCIFFGDP